MSIFNEVVQEHEAKLQKKADEEQARITYEQNKEAEFVTAFKEAVQKVALPIFEEFVRDAVAYGYAAKVEVGTAAAGQDCIAVVIRPIKGASFDNNRAQDCVYQLVATKRTQKVEHIQYYDQRVGKRPGVSRADYAIQSINQLVLTRDLKEFLSRCLSVRESA